MSFSMQVREISVVFFIFCLTFLQQFHIVNSKSEEAFVNCQSGKYKGKTLISRNGIEYEAFQGIRYGIIPGRFEESELAPPNSGEIQNVVDFGPNCAHQIQGVPGSLLGEEDCLYLNVYTPKADGQERKVIVFIHGGGFAFGSGDSYGGSYFIDENIVLVTINYRVGILGFLSTNDDVVFGNYGLKDQTLALKWVQQNIDSFGGDKESVTIMGESAGSASVLYQVLSPNAKGLFSKAIALSGTPLNPWGFKESNVDNIVKVALKLECDVTSSEEILSCFKTKSIKEIVGAQTSLAEWWFPFPPTLEPKSTKNPNPFIWEHPEHLMKVGEFNQVPVLMTMCKDEGLLINAVSILHNEKLRNAINTDWEGFAPTIFLLDEDPILKPHSKELSAKIKNFYLNNQPISEHTFKNFTNIITDAWFFRGIRETALSIAKYTNVYLELITHESKDFSTTQLLGIDQVYGVSHADDLTYLFNEASPKEPFKLIRELKSPEDIEFSKAFVKQIAHFINTETGNMDIALGPSKQWNDKWNPVSEEEINSRKLNWLSLNRNPSLEVNYASDRAQFWDDIVEPYLNFKDEL